MMHPQHFCKVYARDEALMDSCCERPHISPADKDSVKRKLDFTEDDLCELSIASGTDAHHLHKCLCKGQTVPMLDLIKFVCVDMIEMDWKGEEIFNLQMVDFSRVTEVLSFQNDVYHVYFQDGSQMVISKEKLCQWFPPEKTECMEDTFLQDSVKSFRFKKPVAFDFVTKYFELSKLVNSIV